MFVDGHILFRVWSFIDWKLKLKANNINKNLVQASFLLSNLNLTFEGDQSLQIKHSLEHKKEIGIS